MKIMQTNVLFVFMFHYVLCENLNGYNLDHLATLSSQELEYLSKYLGQSHRTKRFVSQAISSAALGSAAAGSRHITNSIGKLIGSSSKSSFGHPSGGGGEDHHYGPPPQHHDSGGKLKEAVELKKIIFNSLLQAVKAVNGGLLAIGGKLIKGSGYLIEAKGRFLASKGDVVSDLGKKIVYAAKNQPSSWSSSVDTHQSIEHPIEHHTSGSDGSFGPPPSHFPSAPSSGYGAPPYHPSGETYVNLPDGVESGLLVLKKVQKNVKKPDPTDLGLSGIPPFQYLPLETDSSAPKPNYPPLPPDPNKSPQISIDNIPLNIELSPPTSDFSFLSSSHDSFSSPSPLFEYYNNVHDIEIGTQKDYSDFTNSFHDQLLSTSNDIPVLKDSSGNFMTTNSFTTDFNNDSTSTSFDSFAEVGTDALKGITEIEDQNNLFQFETPPPYINPNKYIRPYSKKMPRRFHPYAVGGGKNKGRNVRVAHISINLEHSASPNHPKYRNVLVHINRGRRPSKISKAVAYKFGPKGPVRID